MIIHQYGMVILQEGNPIRVENWNIERESNDPQDATNEQLVLMAAIQWAQKKLGDAVLKSFLKRSQELKAQHPRAN